ncbi:MAG: RimJ/RimL family protein N-acetyltransferase [Clostridia bacterium]|nr:RimJ/RimL family protein N-acetyltransferase [Clostridia bacterium]
MICFIYNNTKYLWMSKWRENMRIDSKEIYLRSLEISDAEDLLALQLRNKDFFVKTAPTQQEDFYTLDCQLEYIKRGIHQQENDQRYGFGIFHKEDSLLIGNIMLAAIMRGPFQSCILGYSLDQQYNGRGYISEAVRLLVDFAFNELKLFRIEAGVMPSNIGSIRVLEKAGFQKEGLSRKNIEINGKREDHLLFSKLVEENETVQ